MSVSIRTLPRPARALAWNARLAGGALSLLLAAGNVLAEGPHADRMAQAQPLGQADASSAEYLAAHTRWKSALTAFEESDKLSAPAENGVLFVGSSSVRMWTSLAQDFSSQPRVINRGFGGSTLHECRLLVRELVLRYKPRHVLVYAGDNDLAMGRSPLQVMQDFAALANAVRSALPQARLSFISIKPSPSRAQLLPKVQLANALIAAYLRTQTQVDYIDVYSPMMDAQGNPRAELFLKDQLHLNRDGYRLWHAVISAYLPVPDGGAAVPVAPVAPLAPLTPVAPADMPASAAEAAVSGER